MNIVTLRKKTDTSLIPDHYRASGIMPVLAYCDDEKIFLMDDQTIGFGFLCNPLSGADEAMQKRMNGFLNQEYPTDTTLQFALFRSPDINLHMYAMADIRKNFNNELLTDAIQERVSFLQGHTTKNLIAKTQRGQYDNGLIQDLKLIVTCKVPMKGTKPTREELVELGQLKNKIESGLQSVNLQPLTMTARSYIRVMSTLLNWGEKSAWRNDAESWELDRPICEQVLDYCNEIEVSKDGLKIGDYYAKVLSAKKLPDMYYFGDAVRYVGDLSGGGGGVKDNYLIVTNIHFPNPEKKRGALEKKRQFTVNQAYGPMLKFVPVLADKKEGFDTLYDSMKEGAKPIKISYSVVVFSPSQKQAASSAEAIRTIWAENNFEMMEDKYVSLPMFINSLPLCTDYKAIKDLWRYKTMTTEQAAVLVPIFGEWKGTGTYHMSLISRNGQIMSLSLHDSNTNKNLVIAAESGSGKSFATNELICSYMSEGAQVWVIDAGKSYQKLCETLNGDFVHFEEGTYVSLNPFEHVQNYEDEEDALVNLVSTMASEKGRLCEVQASSLKTLMGELWKKLGNKMKVDDIAEHCLSSKDDRLRDVGTQLHAFTTKGSYGKYFNKNTVSFQNQFTVLELDELQGRTHLRQVVLLQLIFQIQQEVFLGDRNRKKLVIVDEAWDLLKEGEVAKFMEHAYRKFRKYGGSVAIATQSINDLYENAVGRAIAENSASMWLLGQTQETVESVKRQGRLTLSEGGFETLKSVHTIAGAYSEIFIKSKSGMGVGRLIVGEFQKLLYSTDPVDVNDINHFVKQGLSVSEAIRAVIQHRQGGGE